MIRMTLDELASVLEAAARVARRTGSRLVIDIEKLKVLLG